MGAADIIRAARSEHSGVRYGAFDDDHEFRLIRGGAVQPPSAILEDHPHAIDGDAAFVGLFACTGFEYVPVPAGETVDPKRAIGLAMSVSVIGATLLYVLMQIVAMGTLPLTFLKE
jgi:hypothetical protein